MSVTYTDRRAPRIDTVTVTTGRRTGRPTEPSRLRRASRIPPGARAAAMSASDAAGAAWMDAVVELNPDAVLQFVDVTVRRGTKTLLDRHQLDGRGGRALGRARPERRRASRRCMQIAAATMHPTSGEAYVLGERLGRVDVFELRPRIGLATAALADRIPRGGAGHRRRGQRRLRRCSAAGARPTAASTCAARRRCSTGSASATSPSARSAR